MASRIPVTVNSGSFRLLGVYHPVLYADSIAILLHGLGGNKCGRGRFFVAMSEDLASRGIASVRFDFVGNGDSEGCFADGSPTVFLQNILDIVNAVPHSFSLKIPSFITKIGIFGRSFGGYMGCIAAPYIQNLSALAVQSSPFDSNAFSEVPSYVKIVGGEVFFWGEKVSPNFLKQMDNLSVENALRAVEALPILHLSCENDTVIGTSHDEKYARVARMRTGPFSRYIVKQADHECSQAVAREDSIRVVGDFFAKRLFRE